MKRTMIAAVLLVGLVLSASAAGGAEAAEQTLEFSCGSVDAIGTFSERSVQLIADTLAKDMARRPASARAMIEILDQIAALAPWQRAGQRRSDAGVWEAPALWLLCGLQARGRTRQSRARPG